MYKTVFPPKVFLVNGANCIILLALELLNQLYQGWDTSANLKTFTCTLTATQFLQLYILVLLLKSKHIQMELAVLSEEGSLHVAAGGKLNVLCPR